MDQIVLDEVMAEAEPTNQPSHMNVSSTHSVDNMTKNQENHMPGSASMEACNSPSFNNNNCEALLSHSSKPQMIPIIAREASTDSSSVESMLVSRVLSKVLSKVVISRANKVVPVVSKPESATTGGTPAVMLIPNTSDELWIDVDPEHDEDNNCVETSEQCPNICKCDPRIVITTQTSDSNCRFCHDNPTALERTSLCLCKGCMTKVHKTCLEDRLTKYGRTFCEICGYEYNIVRKPKYTGISSVFQWIRHSQSPVHRRILLFDLACFFVLAHLVAISSWLCVLDAQQYTTGKEPSKATNNPDATDPIWTTVSVFSLTGTLLVASIVWLVVAMKKHMQIWSDWQQRNFIVTIIPFEDGCMSRPPPPRKRNLPPSNNRDSPMQTTKGSGKNFQRHSVHNLPSDLNRNLLLRNPPPGYTTSETTMMYQALYGNESVTQSIRVDVEQQQLEHESNNNEVLVPK